MTKLAILEYPDPRLRKTAERVEAVDDAVRQLVADLLETMYAANGVGLAAAAWAAVQTCFIRAGLDNAVQKSQ